MNVLLVDDDPNKVRQLRAFLASEFPDLHVEERNSFQSGLKEALLNTPDLLILDMTMPTYDGGGNQGGGKERRYAGDEILRRLLRKRVHLPVIIVTQFERFGDGDDLITLDELRKELGEKFAKNYLGAVFYQAATSQWQGELRDMLIRAGCKPIGGERL
jgi:CheY-like chemotaxis protein